MRYSRQRELVLRQVQSRCDHPTADEIYTAVRGNCPGLSLGTVYRNLVFFQENGDIQSVGVVKGQERFDSVTTPHSHFICQQCGAVIDLDKTPLNVQLDRDISRQYGLSVERHELTFYGRCPECMQKKEKNEEESLP